MLHLHLSVSLFVISRLKLVDFLPVSFSVYGLRDSRTFRFSALSFPEKRKVHRENFRFRGTFVPWNIRSLELSLLWNFRSSGANVPRTFVPMKLSFHENEYSKNLRSECPKTRPKLAINLTIAYAPAVNNFQQLICRQCSAGVSVSNYVWYAAC